MRKFGFKTLEWIIECGDMKRIECGCVECMYEKINGGVWSPTSGGDERVVCGEMESRICIR